jgi:small subunit ribosomal protein S7
MSRKTIAKKKIAAIDPIYKSEVLAKFVCRMMYEGKKYVALRVIYQTLDLVKEKLGKEPLEVFIKALDNVKPVIEVKSRRVGGATYQVPVEISEKRRDALAMRWIINYSRERHGKTMSQKLCDELVDAYNSTGNSFKKKEDTHKMAEANKAFAHYRW